MSPRNEGNIGQYTEDTEAEYESDFEVDKDPGAGENNDNEDDGKYEYDNDSFIIDDDGANKEGDLTGSTDMAEKENVSKVSNE